MNTTAEQQTRFGIIGVGGRGSSFAAMLSRRNDTVVRAVTDTNPIRAAEVAKRLSIAPSIHASVEDMLKQEALDAVIVTSPDFRHEEHAVSALKGGVNVFVDKPLATTVKGCLHIIRTAEQASKTIMMGFNLRCDPTIQRLKKIVDEGVLGTLYFVENREFYDGGRTYMSRWNRKQDCSGGLWIHKGSHDFDIFNWLLGFPRPDRVSAVAGMNIFTPEHLPFRIKPGVKPGPTCHQCAYREVCPDVYPVEGPEWIGEVNAVDHYFKDLCMYLSEKDIHDNGVAIVEYENGARASHMECFATSRCDRLYTVIGDKGQAEVSLAERTILVRPRWSRDVVTYSVGEVQGGHGGADPEIMESFIQVIRGQRENTSRIEHGLWATAIGQAAELARREQRVVRVQELFD